MTIPYQELRHLDPDTKYKLAITDSRKLLEANLRKSERPDFQERRKKIRSLLKRIQTIKRIDHAVTANGSINRSAGWFNS